jgi:hypothetical protein
MCCDRREKNQTMSAKANSGVLYLVTLYTALFEGRARKSVRKGNKKKDEREEVSVSIVTTTNE